MKEKNSENSQNSKQVLRRLAKFPKEIAGEILGILKPFTINQNTYSEILECLLEISKRDSLKASDLLHQLLEKTSGDNVNRVELLRESLKNLRYPRYQGLLKKFAEKEKVLKLPQGVTISPSPYFEDDDIHLSARISNPEDINKLLAVLNRLDVFFKDT